MTSLWGQVCWAKNDVTMRCANIPGMPPDHKVKKAEELTQLFFVQLGFFFFLGLEPE